MTKQEFEDRTGMKVSAEEYARIENIYLMAGEMGKDEFCREFRAHGHSPLVAELFKTCQNLEEQRLEQVDRRKELEQTDLRVAQALMDRFNDADLWFAYKCVIDLIGPRSAVRYKLEKGYALTEKDRNYLLEELKQGRI